MKPEYEQRIAQYKELIEKELQNALHGAESAVGDAIRYSVLGGGKRIRGILTLEFCRVFGGDTAMAAYIAASVEMIHVFSLIHDDLPCMDDDDMRRGKPSCHKQFGEATALLAGDALLALAFNNVTVPAFLPKGLKPERVIKIMSILSSATGEMIHGQQLDMDYECAEPAHVGRLRRVSPVTEEMLISMYSRKTAALISNACVCGAQCAGANERKLIDAKAYGISLGLAFQITDDLLDYKTEKKGKKTLPHVTGEKAAKEKAREYTDYAVKIAEKLPDGDFLKELAISLINRRI